MCSSIFLLFWTNSVRRFVQVFFEEERLPIAEGWKRSPVTITGDNLGPISDTIVEASEWAPDAGVCSSVTLILSGNDTFVV